MYTSYLRVYTGLCQGRQVDERNEVVHTTSTAHVQLPIKHTCNQVIKDESPLPLTDQTNFLSPPGSATANNGAMTKLLITYISTWNTIYALMSALLCYWRPLLSPG